MSKNTVNFGRVLTWFVSNRAAIASIVASICVLIGVETATDGSTRNAAPSSEIPTHNETE